MNIKAWAGYAALTVIGLSAGWALATTLTDVAAQNDPPCVVSINPDTKHYEMHVDNALRGQATPGYGLERVKDDWGHCAIVARDFSGDNATRTQVDDFGHWGPPEGWEPGDRPDCADGAACAPIWYLSDIGVGKWWNH